MGTNGADENTGRRGDRPSAEEEPRAAERRYRTVIEQSPLSIHVFAPDGRSLLANASWDELWYLEEDEKPEGANVFEDEQLRATGLIPCVERGVAGETVAPPPLLYDPGRTGREGAPRWLQPFVYPVKDEEGRVREVTLIIEDVTERKALEERLAYQALHDDLTGLPNRALFVDRLRHALERAERRGSKIAVLFLDLDNFKYVNDSLGHVAGDELLRGVAGRLGVALRPEDTLARLGGDEFAILLEDVVGPDEATGVADRVARELRAPFLLYGHEVFVTASTGVVLGGPGEAGGDRAEDLLRNADITMYRGKEGGKDRREVFDPATSARPLERLGLEGDLRRAVERGAEEEFEVHYQPEVDLRTGRIVGFEALVRWNHPERGLVPPAEFVPLAEETGLIVPVGRRVLEEACRRAGEWRKMRPGGPQVGVAVNLSARQFRDPGLLEDVARALGESGLDPGALTLELTESILIRETPATLATVQYLKILGVKLAIDDFGTGYSSLSYLKRFPVDYLKIDRSIVDGIEGDPRDEAIVSAAVTLARSLGELVVAEGVESEGQLTRLRELGCDLGQGYLFRKPCPGGESTELLLQEEPPGNGPRRSR